MKFPDSHFPVEMLEEHANRFVIPDRYFNPEYRPMFRTPMVLNVDEVRYIQQELTNAQINDVVNEYYQLSAFDRNFLIPRLPIGTVMKLLKCNKSIASAMKRLCNTLRDIDIDEFNRRIDKLLADQIEKTSIDDSKLPPPKKDFSIYNEKLGKIKRYMNAKQCMKIPKNLGSTLHDIPKFLVKRVWTGPRFETMYTKMLSAYPRV